VSLRTILCSMVRQRQKVVLFLFSIALTMSGPLAVANPVGDFFKNVGRSISHLGKSKPPSRNARKTTTKDGDNKSETSPSATDDRRQAASSMPPDDRPMATPVDVRRAASATPDRVGRRDVPYGVAVPNRPGLVTSPYAPTQGYVDVRGFPSSAEVLDPFTGKIFLTP
jgi:hypothetical protein